MMDDFDDFDGDNEYIETVGDIPADPETTVNIETDFDLQTEKLDDQENAQLRLILGTDTDGIAIIDEDDQELKEFEHAQINYVDPTVEVGFQKSKLVSPNVKVTIIRGDARNTYGLLTKYEEVAAIGFRATMLAKNNPPLISGFIDPDPQKVAEEEFRQNKCPILILRPVAPHIFEEYSINELRGLSSELKIV